MRVIGAVANEFSFAIPPKSELNSTYGFLAQDSRTRTGIAGDPDEVPVSQGRLVNVEDLSGKYNTSYNIIDIVLYRKVASTFKDQAEYRPIGCVITNCERAVSYATNRSVFGRSLIHI